MRFKSVGLWVSMARKKSVREKRREARIAMQNLRSELVRYEKKGRTEYQTIVAGEIWQEEKALLVATLWRAVLDLQQSDALVTDRKAREVRRWFLSPQYSPAENFPFLFICDQLGVNPDNILNKLRPHLLKHR